MAVVSSYFTACVGLHMIDFSCFLESLCWIFRLQ